MLHQIALCILIADFLTGLFHWLEDTYGLPTWPLIGESVIVPNIDHHRHPGLIGYMSTFISRNYQPFVIALGAIILFWLFGWLHWTIMLTAVLAGFGNEVHTWNHSKSKNPVIKFLWDTGLIQSKKQHAMHHIPPYNKYYCTLTNATNAILEVLNFWRGLEWVIALVGVKPKRMSPERDGF